MRPLRSHTALLVLVLAPALATAQTLTGSISGTVTDEQGGALPGVSVTLTGKTGSKTAVTGPDGAYRFAALDPGTYDVRAELTGFRPVRQENLVVTVGKTLQIDLGLKVAGVAEAIEVVGEAPVDVSSSATNTQLSQDLLFNMPIRQGNTATNLLNFQPGINNQSAYGGDASSGNGLLIDGVDTRDPSGGTAWTFYNYNIVEQVQVQGIGQPAEYGAFTGAIVNTITKSGGNRFSGLFDAIYTKHSLAGKNVPADFVKKNPALGQSAKTNELLDFTTQLSGPLIKDKLFFFASAQRYHINQDPAGPRTVRDEVSPRANGKITWQPNPNDNLMAHVQYDEYNIIGRAGLSELVATDDQTNEEDAPEWFWLAQWRHLFGSRTFSEIKYTGWWGYFDLTPKLETAPIHFEGTTSLYTGGQGWFYLADRGRHQVNASVTHYAEAFGKHDLKFGVEIERSRTRDRYGYVNDTYYYDYGGQPYLGYSYGYDISGRNSRESLYAQDAWRIADRLTLNLGVRADFMRGGARDADKVYSTTAVAPRLGFAFDLTGDQKTVVKGSYSQYYEGIFNDMYKQATSGYKPRIEWDMSRCPSISQPCPMSLRTVNSVTNPPTATIDPDIEHPRVDEFSLGFERALGRDIRLVVTGLYRENKNFVGSVLPLARWTPRTVTSTATEDLSSRSLTAYTWANRAASQGTLLVTNPDGFQFRDPAGNVLGAIQAERSYKAVMGELHKRMSHRWYGKVSYVLSRAEGTINNSSEGLFGPSRFYETPTLALVNVKGRLQNDRTHEVKVMLGWQVPVVEVGLNAYFRSLTGRTYQPFQRFSSSQINFGSYYGSTAGRQPFLEPRGARRLPTENILDLRLEKIFQFGGRRDRLAVYADITNATNASTVTGRLTRVPTTSISTAPGDSVSVPFNAPATLIAPRQVTLGARWSF